MKLLRIRTTSGKMRYNPTIASMIYMKQSVNAQDVRQAVPNPKNYYAEIGPLKEKAAEESYNAGIDALNERKPQ